MINKEIVSLAKRVLGKLNPNFDKEMKMGMKVELEHGKVDPKTNVTNDDKIKTAKIALAHLKEKDDYYTKLKKVEQ